MYTYNYKNAIRHLHVDFRVENPEGFVLVGGFRLSESKDNGYRWFGVCWNWTDYCTHL